MSTKSALISREQRRLIRLIPTLQCRARLAVILQRERKKVKNTAMAQAFDDATWPYDGLWLWSDEDRHFMRGIHNYLHIVDLAYNKMSRKHQ